MSESKQTDHWDVLASELGAELVEKAPDESPMVEENSSAAAVESTAAKAEDAATPSVPSPARPARPISNWDALAAELGIEVEAQARGPVAAAEAPRFEAAEKEEDILARQPEEERLSGERFGLRAGFVDRPQRPLRDKSAESGEKKSHQGRRRHRKDRGQERREGKEDKFFPDRGRASRHEEETLLTEPALESDDTGGKAVEQSHDDETREKKGKRRRTHRGSRRKKKKAADVALEKSPGAIKDRFAEQTESVAAKEISSAEVSGEEIFEDESEDDDKRKGKGAFRAIPTWEEAIGVIVAKNMESRPRRHGGGSSASRGHRRS